mgnify:FL=1
MKVRSPGLETILKRMPTPATSLQTVPTSASVATPGPGKQLAKRKSPAPRLRPDETKARQELVLLRTICGLKAKEIAEELHLSVGKVRQELAIARRADLLLAARDRVQQLVPKAIAALEAHLEAGDKDIALLVLEGLGVIGKHVQLTFVPVPAAGADTFDAFRARILQTQSPGHQASHPGAGEQLALSGPVIDAQVEAVASQAVSK